MARFSSWGYEKIGAREMGKAIESDLYRIFYRIIIFFVGLMVIYIGTSSILQYFGINWEFLF